MSVLEKKALAFEKLAAINNEVDIDEILNHLESINRKENAIDLTKNLDAISKRYDTTLKRLAQ